MADLERRGVTLVSPTEQIDTSSPGGRLVFHLFAAMAEFERDLIRERTRAGLGAARAFGRTGGPPSVRTPEKLSAARSMHAADEDGRFEAYDARRAWSSRLSSRPPQRLWDTYTD